MEPLEWASSPANELLSKQWALALEGMGNHMSMEQEVVGMDMTDNHMMEGTELVVEGVERVDEGVVMV
jgi:hypothetical protein